MNMACAESGCENHSRRDRVKSFSGRREMRSLGLSE